ncbi:NAD(P)-dependent alcohol dehydrogenase [Leptospira ognonensis]|uniref:NAD(P)-dependent alcohol dehydrogenase n=1 Tax=Leptospira ognonensis TaxID=2484945 RepID=A0A4R9K2J4_9LEPT|nr:NAD(P)-dependent alcohol dehydrogenase [Leptospira ognonensis]TGL59074.1 NAD(P)-dependent alcohol dehydrogenase [Leptospira ognonensis]
MKAITYRNYGTPEVLRLEELPKPEPKANEILVKIYATAVNSGDYRLRKPDPQVVRLVFGLFKPRNPILGIVFSGEVEAIGKNVTKFRVGDKIYGMSGMKMSTYAEYICLSESATIDIIPDSMPKEEAATIPFGTMTAYHFLTKSKIKSGDKVLIYGASGSVGVAAIQLAKAFGAEVTAICSSVNSDLVKKLGANHVINYDKQDFTDTKETFDIVFDTLGKYVPNTFLPLLKMNGCLILCNASAAQMFWALWKNLTTKYTFLIGVSSEAVENLKAISKLISENHISAVIDKRFPLESMSLAHTYVEAGHKKGNVLIDISPAKVI